MNAENKIRRFSEIKPKHTEKGTWVFTRGFKEKCIFVEADTAEEAMQKALEIENAKDVGGKNE